MELRRPAGAVASAASTSLLSAAAVGPAALATLIALPALAPAVRAQRPVGPSWATLTQRVDIGMAGADWSADVAIRFELGPTREGAALPVDEPVVFELLGFGDATAHEVLLAFGAGGDDETRPAERRRVVLWPTTGSHRMAVVEPPFETDGETLVMRLSYRVENVVEGASPRIHARVPILTGPPVRAEGGGEAFRATVSVPEEWAVTEGFPSGLTDAGSGAYVVSLTVAPSVVGFRARTDGLWRPGLPLVVDVLTVLALVGFAGVGWRHLRGVAAR